MAAGMNSSSAAPQSKALTFCFVLLIEKWTRSSLRRLKLLTFMAKKSVIQFHARPTLILSPLFRFPFRQRNENHKKWIPVMLRRKAAFLDVGNSNRSRRKEIQFANSMLTRMFKLSSGLMSH